MAYHDSKLNHHPAIQPNRPTDPPPNVPRLRFSPEHSPRLRDSRDFSPYLSSTEWADEDKMSSALLEADVEGAAVAGSARFTGFKKEDME
ncbi:hypothetical protein E2C01_018017 [Portunus trituberculatus]|uniref:Uncharacterized protein n=1 Tax=Portunus trituberculatus TaxID=210409 RepID=A0A5B7DVD2_PORTR|nr:hypothetical protein [Portunus trituberculatus]